jgi:hypothetical protein
MPFGARGRGTYHAVIAGTSGFQPPMRYYPLGRELTKLSVLNDQVREALLIRDQVFQPMFQHAQPVKGHFKLSPARRQTWHMEEVMTAIRRRTMMQQRIQQQQIINQKVIADAKAKGKPDPRQHLVTKDAAHYFAPQQSKDMAWANWWHHPNRSHLLPKPKWERLPEFGGVTRVRDFAAAPGYTAL